MKQLEMFEKPYIILFRDSSVRPADAPLAFICGATDGLSAEYKCELAHPKAKIVWVIEEADLKTAYIDYWLHGAHV